MTPCLLPIVLPSASKTQTSKNLEASVDNSVDNSENPTKFTLENSINSRSVNLSFPDPNLKDLRLKDLRRVRGEKIREEYEEIREEYEERKEEYEERKEEGRLYIPPGFLTILGEQGSLDIRGFDSSERLPGAHKSPP